MDRRAVFRSGNSLPSLSRVLQQFLKFPDRGPEVRLRGFHAWNRGELVHGHDYQRYFEQFQFAQIRIRRKGTKTDAGARLIELNQAATEAVTRLYVRAQTLGSSESDHYLFPAELSRHTKDGDPLKGGVGFDARLHQNSWRSAWRSLVKAAGLQGLRFHDLRHSFISFMAERGVPLPIVQSMVGHMSAKMTRYYTHISSQAARQAVELLDVGKTSTTEVRTLQWTSTSS
jgi:integrase